MRLCVGPILGPIGAYRAFFWALGLGGVPSTSFGTPGNIGSGRKHILVGPDSPSGA